MKEAPWESTRFIYTKDLLDTVKKCFLVNSFVISKAFVCVTSIWPDCPHEVAVELLDELDRMRRGEPAVYSKWRDRFNGDWSPGTDKIEILNQ